MDDLPLVPEPAMFTGLRELHDSILEGQLSGDGHLAMAVCRPGGAESHGGDEVWIDALRSTLDDGQIDGTWSLHLGASGRVTPLVEAPDWLWSR